MLTDCFYTSIMLMYFYIYKCIYYFYPPLDREVDEKYLEMYADL